MGFRENASAVTTMRALICAASLALATASNVCYPDGCQPSASIMHSNNASTITIDATAFEAAGLTLSVTTVPLDEARDHWVGGTYSMWGFWGSSPPCPFLAAVPLDFSGAEGCCGYWCDPSECVGTFGRRVDVAAEHLADSASWSKNGAPWKDCPWVAGYASNAAPPPADGTLASESCPAACGGVLAVSLEASCYDERAEEIRATIGVATAAPTAAGDGPETAALSCELYDAFGNCVDDGCQRWCPFRRPSISRRNTVRASFLHRRAQRLRRPASGVGAAAATVGGDAGGGDGGWLDAQVWARAAAEHASTASFASFALLLAARRAARLLAEAAGMADEVRHAEDAYAVAGRLAGASAAPMALAVDDAAERRKAAPSRARAPSPPPPRRCVDRELVRPAAASVLAGRPPAFGGLRPGLRALGDEIAAALARD
ncbi:hypothetical protein JL722_4670 [Aureococcus anophagefferens]|nr:hypothetical protein JL722_4670 [Aureococcus anophagefferens]